MIKVTFFEKKVKLQGQRSEVQGHGIKWKVLPEEIHIWNMKALSSTNHKLWPRLKFLKKRSNSMVKGQRVKVMESNERYCQKEYTCEIWKPYHLTIKSYDQGLRFWKCQTPRSKVRRLRSWYQIKGLARRNTDVKYESPIT
jgi:hypothetical protein